MSTIYQWAVEVPGGAEYGPYERLNEALESAQEIYRAGGSARVIEYEYEFSDSGLVETYGQWPEATEVP